MLLAPVSYVQVGVFHSLTGFSPDAIQKLIARGEWREGVHFRKRNGRILIDLRAYETWVETPPPA